MLPSRLLALDSLVNLAIGATLLLSPIGVLEVLGLPQPDSLFYVTILGGVIAGIGVALLVEY